MLIGELSKQSGFSRDTIRYYEKLGLIVIHGERTTGNGYKHYSQQVVERLSQIQCLKESGFTLREIQRLLLSDGKRNVCHDLPNQLAEKLSKIDEQIAVLLNFRTSLREIQTVCNGGCSTRKGMPECIPPPRQTKPTSPCC